MTEEENAYWIGFHAGQHEGRQRTEGLPQPTRGFMCKTDFDQELGDALGGCRVYADIEDLTRCQPCVAECGIVEVEVSLVNVHQPMRKKDDT